MDVAVRRWIGLLLLTLALAGCQNAPNASIELLESELRWMEDQLYAMDQQLDQKSLQLASCQRNSDALRSQVEQGIPAAVPSNGTSRRRANRVRANSSRTNEDSSGRTRPSGPTSNSVSNDPNPDTANDLESSVDVPDIEQFESDLVVPDVDLGPGVDPEWLPEPASPQSPNAEPEEALNEADSGRSTSRHQVAKVRLNPQLTGGYDFDGHPGDEGLFVVVEPQDAAGSPVRAAGPMSITVIDPKIPNRLKQLARWEFTATETAAAFKKTLLGNGITLKLPWPNESPRSTTLQVHVEFEPEPGQRLVASREVLVKQSGSLASRNGLADEANRRNGAADPLLSDPMLSHSPLELGMLLPDQMVSKPSPNVGQLNAGNTWPRTRQQRISRRTPAAPTLRAPRLTPIWQTQR